MTEEKTFQNIEELKLILIGILGGKIRDCINQGLNQTDVGHLLGVTQQQVSILLNYEKYKNKFSVSFDKVVYSIRKLTPELTMTVKAQVSSELSEEAL